MEQEEWCCVECGKWLAIDDVVFMTKDNVLSVIYGDPYCVSCLPSQQEKRNG